MMPISSPSRPLRTDVARAARTRRWIGLAVASLLLHLAVVNWAGGHIELPPLRDQNQTAVSAALLPPPPPAESAKTEFAKAKPAARKPRAHAAKPAIASVAPPAAQQTAADAISSDNTAAIPAGIEAPGTSTEPVAAAADTSTNKPDNTPDKQVDAGDTAAIRYKVDPPPSAELKYDVQALRDGQTVYGSGKIGWQSDGSSYVINGEAGVLFLTVLNFKSEGAIDAFGVAPVIYSEKRFRKSETNTHFQRERNIISFSASTASYPRSGGEQDRASVIWQLAGIGRGDRDKFVPDADFKLFVAGVRDAETWNIHVIGQEDVALGSGKTNAWHVVRAPRTGSYDQKLDIWLAPQQQWYPVKLRYTERNGDYLDMSLSQINPINSVNTASTR